MKKRGLDSLLEALAEAVGQARAYFLKLDGEAVVRPGAWGPAEVLSHLVFWHRANLEGMESVLAGGQPYQPGASIEELNVGALNEMAGSRVTDLLSEWEDLQNRLDGRARAMPDPSVVVRVYKDGTVGTLLERVPELAGHITEHLMELEESGSVPSP